MKDKLGKLGQSQLPGLCQEIMNNWITSKSFLFVYSGEFSTHQQCLHWCSLRREGKESNILLFSDIISFYIQTHIFFLSTFLTESSLLVLLFHPSYGTQGITCCFGMHPPVPSKHGIYCPIILSHHLWLIVPLFHADKLVHNVLYAQVILGEEVAASKLTLFEITKQISDAVQARAEQGLNYLNYLSPVFIFSLVVWDLVSHSYVLFRQIPRSSPPARRFDREHSWSVCTVKGIPPSSRVRPPLEHNILKLFSIKSIHASVCIFKPLETVEASENDSLIFVWC